MPPPWENQGAAGISKQPRSLNSGAVCLDRCCRLSDSCRGLGELFCDEGFHFGQVLLGALEELELSLGADEVVFGILDFVVGVAVDIVCQEAYGLHVREECCCVGQVLYFDG